MARMGGGREGEEHVLMKMSIQRHVPVVDQQRFEAYSNKCTAELICTLSRLEMLTVPY